MCPLQTKDVTLMFPLNSWDLSRINLIYAHLLQIQLCRDYAFFGGHFWPKFGGRGHKNILVGRASGCTLFLQSAELVSSATGSHHLSI